MPALPTIQQIYDIAAGNSSLTELTLCAYLSCGRWQWSGSASDYGRAFSLFPNLRKLAINHDDLAIFPNMTEEAESCGNFAMTCSREGALLRRQFVEAVVALATSIAEVAICPFEQENSRMKVIRLGGETVSVDFVEESNRFFWELL